MGSQSALLLTTEASLYWKNISIRYVCLSEFPSCTNQHTFVKYTVVWLVHIYSRVHGEVVWDTGGAVGVGQAKM